MSARPLPDDVQERYAQWLEWGTRAGLLLLVAGLLLYVSGMVDPHVPIERLPELWGLPANRFLEEARIGPGWGWATLLHRGDLMAVGGIAVLAGCSVIPLAAGAWRFAAQGERTYAVLCALEIAVLVLAASGVFAGGH
ncbi:MAG TPA: hypothetical protein VFK48_05915 [Usitatibacter sp.]|nr:hypothetical protein [Usitatibacter sp.]